MAKTPAVIGITGGIGSGKSLVSRIFSVLGIPVYEADHEAKVLMNTDVSLRNELLTLLGKEAYLDTGEYNRQWVAGQVFGNPDLLTKLNSIVHPRVRQHATEWMTSHEHQAPYLLYEAAIMKAAGESNVFRKVIVVEAPLELRIKRVKHRDQRSEQAIRDIIDRQASAEERQRIADFVLLNDEQTPVIDQVLQLDTELRAVVG